MEVLNAWAIRAVTPDWLVSTYIKFYPDEVDAATEEHRDSLRNPPKSRSKYLEMLEKQGLKESVSLLRRRL